MKPALLFLCSGEVSRLVFVSAVFPALVDEIWMTWEIMGRKKFFHSFFEMLFGKGWENNILWHADAMNFAYFDVLSEIIPIFSMCAAPQCDPMNSKNLGGSGIAHPYRPL